LRIEHLASEGEEWSVEGLAWHLSSIGVRYIPDHHEATREAVSGIIDLGHKDTDNSSRGWFDSWICGLPTCEIHGRLSIRRLDIKMRSIAAIRQKLPPEIAFVEHNQSIWSANSPIIQVWHRLMNAKL
jgi:hypothetical protein